ncbi:MAG: glycolate oxidase subunit GlcE [Polaromonas sp. 28-63-22]|nr:MAG: glycolate oxidase subunit GlcE [Polaromonas sp. 28-63-22]
MQQSRQEDSQAVVAALAARVRQAAKTGVPLRIRGGGSKDFYGQSLKGEVLDMTALSGVVAYEPSELVVSVLAGTPLAALEALLAAQGQCLPFEPPHFNAGSTVGGMVASGLSGPARASAGAVRDFVLGVKLINGRGEELTFGGQVMKNVAGYDVSRLMAGSMGTLGVITEVSLKVLPVAPLEATLRFDCSQAQALQWLHGWGGQPLPLNASCWLQEEGRDTGTLYLRLRGAQAAVEAACDTLCRSQGATREDSGLVAADWQACRNQQLPWFQARSGTQDLWRLSVPQTAPVLDLPEPPLIEWHGGQRWVRAHASQGEQLRQVASDAGGHATLFIAAGADTERARARFDALKRPLDRIHRNLKAQFDPAGILNPHRMSLDY